jgi:hypothetical protein
MTSGASDPNGQIMVNTNNFKKVGICTGGVRFFNNIGNGVDLQIFNEITSPP